MKLVVLHLTDRQWPDVGVISAVVTICPSARISRKLYSIDKCPQAGQPGEVLAVVEARQRSERHDCLFEDLFVVSLPSSLLDIHRSTTPFG